MKHAEEKVFANDKSSTCCSEYCLRDITTVAGI